MCGAPLGELSGSGRLRETDSLSESRGSGERESGGEGGDSFERDASGSRALPLHLAHLFKSRPVPSCLSRCRGKSCRGRDGDGEAWKGEREKDGRRTGEEKKQTAKTHSAAQGAPLSGPRTQDRQRSIQPSCMHRPPPTSHLTTRIRKKKKKKKKRNRPRLC